MALTEKGQVNHLCWEGDRLRFLDQTFLPNEIRFEETSDYRVICKAIRRLAIRGAPAIGVAAGYALALGAKSIQIDNLRKFKKQLNQIKNEISSVRPTAVNLFWAVDRLMQTIQNHASVDEVIENIISEAKNIHKEDIKMCRTLSEKGKVLIPNKGGVMTYCNTGGLATGGFGTALGVIQTAYFSLSGEEDQDQFQVIVNETRPLLQGARLTAWELQQSKIPYVLITDNMAANLFARGKIQCVIVGADRIALNGDTANKIGTYNLAILANYHNVPFYVAAPTTTIDPQIQSGVDIPIEIRKKEEVTQPFGMRMAPQEANALNFAFDVTPSNLITAIITEKGIHKAPYKKEFLRIF